MNIGFRKAQLELLIEALQKDLASLKESCTHPNVAKIAKSDTGNWCPVDDAYWYECKCPDCDKRWNEDQ